jgi:pyridoxal phosphate enzyme (YggS family)
MSMSERPLADRQIADRLCDNVARVRERIAAAAARAGRDAAEVWLVGVTKYVSPEVSRLLVTECGLTHLGESRPQELWRKAESLADLSVNWHLIGHLQRNKVRRTLPLVACIQSADSLPLLDEINREAVSIDRPADVLLEVNVSGDAAKHGFQPDEIEPLLPRIAELKNIHVLGLMTMAALEGGPERARRDFGALRALRDKLTGNCPDGIILRELSMGMSDDFEVAIEEGATIVRVGSALFEGIG